MTLLSILSLLLALFVLPLASQGTGSCPPGRSHSGNIAGLALLQSLRPKITKAEVDVKGPNFSKNLAWAKVASKARRAAHLQYFAEGRLGVRLRFADQETWMPLPVRPQDVQQWLLGSSREFETSLGFVTQGMTRYNMTTMPVSMLDVYWDRWCAGLQREKVPPLAIVPVAFWSRHSSFPAVSLADLSREDLQAGALLANALKTQGWAKIWVGDEQAQLVGPAYNSLLQLDTARYSKKPVWAVHFDPANRDRYVGYGGGPSKKWLNLRSGIENRQCFSFPAEVEGHSQALLQYFDAVGRVARTAFTALLPHVGLSSLNPHSLLSDSPCRHASGFGASVMRALVYSNLKPPSGAPPVRGATSFHADLGLLTVAPPANIPALELWNPKTGERVQVERGLRPDEWIVFGGETLAFLTGGIVPAPVHHVPVIEREAGERQRTSMPYFLRGSPDATLVAPGGNERMTVRTWIKRRAESGSPWTPALGESGGDY